MAKDQFAEENWKNNPNLVKGGDFEHGRGYPDGWEPLNARPDYYRYVSWRAEAGNPKNKVLRMDIPKDIAESTGVLYYSQFFKIQEGATYRFQCRYRTNGPSPKVFIKCYDEMPTRVQGARFVLGGESASETGSMNQPGGAADKVFREVYRSQQNLKGPKGEAWNTQTEDFTPKHTKYSPKAARVDLYGYLSPGIIEWDDVVVKEVIPATTSAGQGKAALAGDQGHHQGDGRERPPQRRAEGPGAPRARRKSPRSKSISMPHAPTPRMISRAVR